MSVPFEAKEIASLLTWKQRSASPELLRSGYEQHLEQRFRSLCENQHGDIQCIAESLDLLPPQQRSRFLRSPLVASRLLTDYENSVLDYRPIAKGLLAELAIAGMVDVLEESIWTALGDRRLDPGKHGSWNAPPVQILGTEIVIDAEGPTDFSGPATGRLVLADADEREAVKRKVADAAAAIAAASEHALSFWSACQDVVALRKAADLSAICSSNSFIRNARLAVIVNGHLPAVQTASIADAIVHEAIHSLLFMYEETRAALVARDGEAISATVTSPWTRKELFLSAYVHACIIWYGLFWFWHEAKSRRSFSADYCDYFSSRAAKGFAQGALTGVPAELRRFLSEPAIGLLGEIESQMS